MGVFFEISLVVLADKNRHTLPRTRRSTAEVMVGNVGNLVAEEGEV